jgi:hypothetical protein
MRTTTLRLRLEEAWLVKSLRRLPRSEQRWLQTIALSLAEASSQRNARRRRQVALARAHRFAPSAPPLPDPNAVRPSSCCGAESYVWRRSGDTLYLRCSACTHLCEERSAYPLLRVVDETQDGVP